MKTITKFIAGAAVALSMAGAANAATFITVGASSSIGANQISWTGSPVGGGTLTIAGISTLLNFDDSVFNDGAGLNSVLTLSATSASNAGNLQTFGSNFVQQELTGTFEFRSLDLSTVYLAGTFAHYWLQGTVGSTGSGNVTSSVGVANFSSDLVDLSFVKGDNFQFGFVNTSPAFAVPGGTLRDFAGSNVTGSFAGVVPEPGTWALMIIGFGGAGAMIRSRRRQMVAA